MESTTSTPFGAWRSPITAASIAAGMVRLGQIEVSGAEIYWLESRPVEGGRYVVARHAPDGTTSDVTPPEVNVRTRVHEYGGGAYLVHGETVFFTNFADQRLYRQDAGQDPQPIMPEPAVPTSLRYADGSTTPNGRLIIAVQERHLDGGQPVNELVALPTDGSTPPHVIATGHDFYAFPRVSPDGRRLAWICWDHPRMPWDGTELWVADLGADGTLSGERQVAGGPEESIFQPGWSPSGQLHFISDRSGWWNLYRVRDGVIEPLAPMEAEFGEPQWVFGLSRYAFLPDGRIACIYTQEGLDHLGLIPPDGGRVDRLATGFTTLASLKRGGRGLVFLGGSATTPLSVVTLDPDTGAAQVLRRSSTVEVDPDYLSAPQSIAFPTEGGLAAHALYYPPANRDYTGPLDERPPLLVMSHGGPTGATSGHLNLEIQFWTSRGIAVVDVNYGGSTGYGRAYRERLKGQWGIVDVADCINAARFLIDRGKVDGERLAIRGGSAGGYTTLSALTFHDVFAAGASYYGVADLEALAAETHKFESRYLDGLVGPYPADKRVYQARSPIHFTDRLSCPVILLQGLEDKVVPPAQAEAMVRALEAKGLPYAYLAFEGEQHGFRRAENIQRSLEAELYFYSRVFGFDLADPVEPVPIENLA